MALTLYDQPHHDGSPTYVPHPPTHLGDQVEVWVRVPHSAGVTRMVARQVHDGEPFGVPMEIAWTDDGAVWWRGVLTARNPVLSYRFLTDGGPFNYQWLTAAGCVNHDPTDAGDFRLSIHPSGPQWLEDAVIYQIFPDRFARSEYSDQPSPEWAWPADWDELPIYEGPKTGVHYFGGDLFGVAERLPHLEQLGVNTVYLTPVFPAPSNHRYNASSFAGVDPLLGGDEALTRLTAEAHRRGMRVIGDFTTNHTGSTHEWFVRAQQDVNSPESRFYYFGDTADDYEGWFGDSRLPKVDHTNPELQERMVTGQDSPIRRFLRSPMNLDGWRIDVANMTGRHRSDDVSTEVARAVRTAVLSEQPEAYVVAEHFHDFRDDLPGDGWHGVMNYAGFTRPMWSWLSANNLRNWQGLGGQWPSLPGSQVVPAMRQYTSVPWQHLLSSMTLLASHDTARIATILADDPARIEVAVAALMSYPGVPMVWAGDEIGLEGINGEDARRAFPWQSADTWNHDTFDTYRSLIAVRRGSPALKRGSLRWLYADDDRLVYVRELAEECVLVTLSRAAGDPIALPRTAIGVQDIHKFDTLYGSTALVINGSDIVLPESGPAAYMWRWQNRQSQRGGSDGQSGA
jgi:alpha-glucosidase